MGEINIILNILAVTVAGAAVWTMLSRSSDTFKRISLSTVMTRLKMPSDQKEILREQLINHCAEGCEGSWDSRWGQPTGERN
jgi:hypothetical protein